ncbi:MAG: type 1 glutamine amidotransferase [Lachnospiraceae bacterium]
MQENKKSLTILHLYPDLLNLYGDRGNIACIRRRLEWRGMGANIKTYTCDDTGFSLDGVDIVFLGGGSDREQKIVCERLLEHQSVLKDYVEAGGTLIAVCGGYQLLGNYYKLETETLKGLEILDIYTEQGKGRLIGNIVLQTDFQEQCIVGFENHGGRTYIGNHTPLGKVLVGYGNNETRIAEGVRYKNVYATYLHGPLLPKNPQLCDTILLGALRRKYPDMTELLPLDDTLENTANEYIVQRFSRQ